MKRALFGGDPNIDISTPTQRTRWTVVAKRAVDDDVDRLFGERPNETLRPRQTGHETHAEPAQSGDVHRRSNLLADIRVALEPRWSAAIGNREDAQGGARVELKHTVEDDDVGDLARQIERRLS